MRRRGLLRPDSTLRHHGSGFCSGILLPNGRLQQIAANRFSIPLDVIAILLQGFVRPFMADYTALPSDAATTRATATIGRNPKWIKARSNCVGEHGRRQNTKTIAIQWAMTAIRHWRKSPPPSNTKEVRSRANVC